MSEALKELFRHVNVDLSLLSNAPLLDYKDRPTTTKDSPKQSHHISHVSCVSSRVSTLQWEGFCRAAERARSPALPFNRINGKAALALSVRGPSLYVRIWHL